MTLLHHRVPPPIVLIGFIAMAWGLSGPEVAQGVSVLQWLVVLVIFLIGSGFLCLGLVGFRRCRTTVNPLQPHAATTLVTSGIYSVSRNPMYVGFAFWLLAWVIWLGSGLSVIALLGYVSYIHWFQILPEERALMQRFGEQFRDYQQRVRPWL